MSAPGPDGIVKATAAAISAAGVAQRLMDGPAVVLERIARGGGATNWYWLQSINALDQLCSRLHPGSVVSFYFDDRIQHKILDGEVEGAILDLVVRHGDAVVGKLSADGLGIAVDFVAGPSELSEMSSTLPAGGRVFFGAFPGRDNDGIRAITVTLPDVDGVVREHPH
jgi:hypothetical protein